jgi:tetratricopeptide (TPR) repeat protein
MALLLALVLAAFQPAAAQPARGGEAGAKTAASKPSADELRGRILKLMDRVISDPSDEDARKDLRVAAGQAVETERSASDAERKALLAGMGQDQAKIQEMRAAKKARFDAWKRDFSKACSLASSADTVKEAVAAYEHLLETFPVYSDNRADLIEAGIRIKGIFYKVIKDAYPTLVAGRDSIDERTLAALQFSRVAALQEYGGAPDTTAAEKELKKAERFRRLERELAKQHENIKTAMDLYEKKRYASSLRYFDEAVSYDRGNEEALFFWELVKKRTGAVTNDER